MTRKGILLLIIIILLTGLFITAKLTYVITFYKVRTSAMLPNYNINSWIMVSSLKTFSYNDIVCYNAPPLPDENGKSFITFHRIAALEGDTVEINDGYLLRNGYMVDSTQKLMFNYEVKRKVVKSHALFQKLKVEPIASGNNFILCLTYNEYKDLSRDYLLHKFNKPKKQKESNIFGSTDKNCWNASNYGPIVVPKGYCFVLGDNRDNSTDSRFRGFIPLKDIVATAIIRW